MFEAANKHGGESKTKILRLKTERVLHESSINGKININTHIKNMKKNFT